MFNFTDNATTIEITHPLVMGPIGIVSESEYKTEGRVNRILFTHWAAFTESGKLVSGISTSPQFVARDAYNRISSYLS